MDSRSSVAREKVKTERGGHQPCTFSDINSLASSSIFFYNSSLTTFDTYKIFKMSKSFNIHVEGIEKEFPRRHGSAVSENTNNNQNQFSYTQPRENPSRVAVG
jgi:hypothetical protein